MTQFGRTLMGCLLIVAAVIAAPAKADSLSPQWVYSSGSESFRGVAISPDGTLIAAGCVDGTVRILDASTGDEIRVLESGDDAVAGVTFSPDGTLLACGSGDTARVWVVETGALAITMSGHEDGVLCAVFSPDGSQLATGSYDQELMLWDVSTGDLIRLFSGHQGTVAHVAFSPDGGYIASASGDDTVRIWDVNTGEHLRTLDGHSSYVHAVAFSPDGTVLATGSWDNSVKLWDTTTWQNTKTLSGHEDDVETVAFAGCGAFVASGGDDSQVKLWDPEIGSEIAGFSVGEAWVWAIAVSPDSRAVATAAGTEVALWDVSGIAPACPTGFGSDVADDCSQSVELTVPPGLATDAELPSGCIRVSELTQFLGLISTGAVRIGARLSPEPGASVVAELSFAAGSAAVLAPPILRAGTWHFTASAQPGETQTCSVAVMSFPTLVDLAPLRYSANGEVSGLAIELFSNLLRTRRGSLDLEQYYVTVASDDVASLEVSMRSSAQAVVYLRRGSPVEVADGGAVIADAFARTINGTASLSVSGDFLKPGKYYMAVEATGASTLYTLVVDLATQ